jgi:hypothetical protein
MTLQLPVSVYQYDQRTKRYAFHSCLQFHLRAPPLPCILTSSTGQGLLSENLDLLKAAMRAPAVVLCKGTRTRIYNASCDEVHTLPPTEPVRVLRAFELTYLNLSTQIAHYRLRTDGALALVDTGRLHCAMCHIPEHMELEYIRSHLMSRRATIHKLLRDRRLVIEMGDRTTVFSVETLRRKGACDRNEVYKNADAPSSMCGNACP